MPPKRKRGGAAAAGPSKAKKTKVAAASASTSDTVEDKIAALKEAVPKKKKTFKVDEHCSLFNAAVHEDYDCMLNQTNIGANNNKYYVIQLLQANGNYYTWNRWGRVGEPGQNSLKGPFKLDNAVKDFEKKFRDKTKNAWANRDSFTPAAGKYTLIEMDDGDEDDLDDMREKLKKLDEDYTDGAVAESSKKAKYAESKLPKETQTLMNLIFNTDTFVHTMKEYDIDVKKMPLGKLSKNQIAKGFDVLEDLESAINLNKKSQLAALTSRFYTLIPHNFGRRVPPVIGTLEIVRKKKDMLLVLADIEFAQTMQKGKKSLSMDKNTEVLPNPADENYELLNTDLEVVPKASKEFKIIEKYTSATKYGNLKILDVWKVNRHGEDKRFLAHDAIENRKLLWHGTNVAVVAAIMKSGLRIMPHSGGRVGKGIYFASENSKSAGYVGSDSTGTGIMFLNEVALGKEHHIARDDHTLKVAPPGYDSIVAKGWTEPDPKFDTTIEIDKKTITVPQGAPVKQGSFSHSSFSQSEYLVYKESQCRIRYMLKCKMY